MPQFPVSHGTDRQNIPKRFMLISSPRTCSNLFMRVMNGENQPNTKNGAYHFLKPLFTLATSDLFGTSVDEWDPKAKEDLWDLYKQGLESLEEGIGLEAGKIGFTKEHVETLVDPVALSRYLHGAEKVKSAPMRLEMDDYPAEFDPLNQTIFPDSYLLTWHPIFIIRNPIRTFESLQRAMSDVYAIPGFSTAPGGSRDGMVCANATLSWTRTLYTFYTSRGVEPLVVDADDLIVHTKSIGQQLAAQIGFDQDVLQYEWKEATPDELAKQGVLLNRMLDTLDASAGVQANPDKLAGHLKNPAEQMERWVGMFGEDRAKELLSWTEAAMPDYEWLRERRLMP